MAIPVRFLLTSIAFVECASWIIDPGPQVIATKGEVWPKPQRENKENGYYVLSTSYFHFNIISEYCSLLQEAKLRYTEMILADKRIAKKYAGNETNEAITSEKYLGVLKSLDVSLTEPCTGNELPELHMDENYTLTIPSNTTQKPLLEAKSVWGILRGLESFSQLIYTYDNDPHLYLNATEIIDYPRFSHRGLLLDTSRHYLSTEVIYKHLDAMSYNKMNVFHWHIVDDQSFPYQSALFPELSNKGAYHPQHQIYTAVDVRAIIEYSRQRGIRVVPEFDTPGHTRSWGEGIPESLSTCYQNNKATDRLGPMDPSREFVFSFLNDFLGEIESVFPDKHLHLGGDEVPFDCWQDNPDISAFMDRINISGNYEALQRYFMQRLLNITTSQDAVAIVWEEVFNSGTKMPEDTIVQVWYSQYYMLDQITLTGRRALYSTCWYLDHISTGGDWKKYYLCDPQNFNGDEKQLKLILGGEACMWGEVVNDQNVLSRTWPRAAAVAEKLWSAYHADNLDYATRRIEEQTCRLNRRGIPAQPPNGPGYCLI